MVVLVEMSMEHGQWSVARSRRCDRDAPQAAQIDRSGPNADPVTVLTERGQWSAARSRRRDRDAPQAAQIDRSSPDADPRK